MLSWCPRRCQRWAAKQKAWLLECSKLSNIATVLRINNSTIYKFLKWSTETKRIENKKKRCHLSQQHNMTTTVFQYWLIASNYRPVSLTSNIIKSFECVVRKQLVAHLEAGRFISMLQHGFQSGCSTLTQLLAHLDNALWNLNNGN